MKKILFFSLLIVLGCNKNAQSHPPVGGILSKSDLDVSKERTKNLNAVERSQIKEWISNQDEKFYPTRLSYWVNREGFNSNINYEDGDIVTYEYDIYDFDNKKVYEESVFVKNAVLGRMDELKAIEDALHYLEKGQEVKMLVPSSLAYGTYGDQDRIDNDVPLIIKLKSYK